MVADFAVSLPVQGLGGVESRELERDFERDFDIEAIARSFAGGWQADQELKSPGVKPPALKSPALKSPALKPQPWMAPLAAPICSVLALGSHSICPSQAHEQDRLEAWTQAVRCVGQMLPQLRQAKGLSLDQLQLKSYVPLYHLRALEAGCLEGLPAPIYVQGFLRQICRALGPEGAVLWSKLPQPPLVETSLTDWTLQPSPTGTSLTPLTLYAGYALLVAGAAGGLSLTLQSTAQVPISPAAQQQSSQSAPAWKNLAQGNGWVQGDGWAKPQGQAATLLQRNLAQRNLAQLAPEVQPPSFSHT